MTEAQALEHDRLYKEAAALHDNELNLHSQEKGKPGWFLARKLRRAVNLYNKVVELNPGNWAAMWLAGKVEQRLGNRLESLNWLARSYQVNASHPDVAREASMAAMDLGRSDDAIAYAHRAAQLEPSEGGLQANLALAYLLAGRVEDARFYIHESLKIAPEDNVSKTVETMVEHFAQNGMTPPRTTPDILIYWKRLRKS